MPYQAIRLAEYRLTEALSRLNRAQRVTRVRYLEKRADERDLALLMTADADVERAAADVRIAKGERDHETLEPCGVMSSRR